MNQVRVEQDGCDVLIWIKAVPNASRDALAQPLNGRLKVRITAAPEAGKANVAICKLIARACNVKPRQVAIDIGGTHAEKIIRIADADAAMVAQCLDR